MPHRASLGDGQSDPLGTAHGSPPRRALQTALAASYALIGGSLAAVLLFNTGLSYWALIVGLAATVSLIAMTAHRSDGEDTFRVLAAHAFAFAVLTWPVLILAADLVWGEAWGGQ